MYINVNGRFATYWNYDREDHPREKMSESSEDNVREPEEIRMARLHSLLTKKKDASSAASGPPKKKDPRHTQIAFKDSQRIIVGQTRKQMVFDLTPPRTPSRTDRKPSPRLTRAAWRAAAMLQYHQKAMEIRSQQADNQTNIFPFQALPPELRIAVYFELLVTDDRLLPTWRGPRKATRQQKKMYINILLTCKMCRDEGLQVLYGENIFDFGEICDRPNNFSKPFVKHVGLHNASLIRVVYAEHSAAAEERYQTHLADPENGLKAKPKTPLTVSHLRSFFSTFNIALTSLRLLAISIIPYQYEQEKNEKGTLGRLLDDMCEREKGLVRAEYWKDIDRWIGINFAPPSSGREWVVYQGVRGREDMLEEGKEENKEENEEENEEEKEEVRTEDEREGTNSDGKASE